MRMDWPDGWSGGPCAGGVTSKSACWATGFKLFSGSKAAKKSIGKTV